MALFENVMIDETMELDASAEEVFALLKDIDNWPNWVRAIEKSYANSKGDWRVGYKITFKANIAPIPLSNLKIVDYQEGRVMEWGIRSPVLNFGHRFEVTPLGKNKCRLRQSEGGTGILSFLTKPANGLVAKFDTAWGEDIRAYFAKKAKAA